METGLGMAGVPPSVQPGGQPDLLPATVSKQILFGLLSLGQKGWTVEETTSLLTLGATRQDLVLGPPQPRGSLPKRSSPLHTD